jgi:RNA polymerase sigma-70 factor (ECF subfamily)
MSSEQAFAELMKRVRAGDADAAAELVRQFEPEIRRTIRVKLADSRLHRLLDSVDICQSVLANFFVRTAAGQYELNEPRDVLKLLVTMARNKLYDKVREQQADRRDQRRLETADSQLMQAVADGAPTPSRILAGRELLQRVHQHLTDDERQLMEQRAHGMGWNEIAAQRGESAEALRKKLARAMNRVSEIMGLDSADEE